ncbi:hypothetical protein ACT2FY_39470 [Paraburkholderia fungorum]|uniref:hypothetical protein n=1 Tax=Paraburkholderia fungorum TaxID=134537 RepID=UPI00402B5571
MTWVNPFNTVSLGGGSKPIIVTEPVTIGATVAAPTKPTAPTVDYMAVVDDATGWCDLQMRLSAETSQAGATTGNGIYLFRLPGGYQFDLSAHPADANISTALNGWEQTTRMIPGSKGFVSRSDGAYGDLVASPYDATRFFLWKPFSWEKVASSWFQLAAGYSGIGYQIAFRFRKG